MHVEAPRHPGSLHLGGEQRARRLGGEQQSQATGVARRAEGVLLAAELGEHVIDPVGHADGIRVEVPDEG